MNDRVDIIFFFLFFNLKSCDKKKIKLKFNNFIKEKIS